MAWRKKCRTYALIMPIGLGACGVPQFDIPERGGSPTVASIVERVTCELVDMVEGEGDEGYKHKTSLLVGDYQVGVSLSLTVLDGGELAPSFNYFPNSIVSLNGGLKFAKTREQNFTQTYFFSMANLHQKWKDNHKFGQCPEKDTNLAGELGIENTVSLALTAPNRNVAAVLNGTQGEFGGYVTFAVIRNVNSFGPTWTLANFKGPGNLAGLSRVNTDKITFGFAPAKTPSGAKISGGVPIG